VHKHWRQTDVGRRAGVSAATVSNIERGKIGGVSLQALRRVAAALEVRIVVVAHWRGAELDRLLSARHADLTTAVATFLRSLGWEVAPEVSFAVYGERGFIDLLAWHASSQTLLVIEDKTELVDVQEMLGTVDRKTRLASRIARDRGWHAATVSTWVVVGETSTNRHRAKRFGALLSAALPADGRAMSAWLRAPSGRIAAISFFSKSSSSGAKQSSASPRRIRVTKSSSAPRG
jgi:Helix-turn-helix.